MRSYKCTANALEATVSTGAEGPVALARLVSTAEVTISTAALECGNGTMNEHMRKALGIANEVSVDRYQIAAGWFLTPTVVLKGESGNQKYNDFPQTDIRNRGKFNGFVLEGIVAF